MSLNSGVQAETKRGVQGPFSGWKKTPGGAFWYSLGYDKYSAIVKAVPMPEIRRFCTVILTLTTIVHM